eukprot:COSAG01_NODE_144_length_24108_cov_11.490441_27_plen_150_part_00
MGAVDDAAAGAALPWQWQSMSSLRTPTKATNPNKPPSILIDHKDGVSSSSSLGSAHNRQVEGAARRVVNLGTAGQTPKMIKTMLLTPNEIRRAKTFKKRRRPRSAPGASRLQSQRPQPIRTPLQQSHRQTPNIGQLPGLTGMQARPPCQ